MADDTSKSQPWQQARDLEDQARRSQQGIVGELTDFLLHNKKWWLTPIIVVLMLLGLLVVLSGTGAAPFIYTLF